MNTMKLDVILRTHSGPNVHKGNRFVDVPKEELILRNLRSLVASMNRVKDADMRLTIIDDHSTESCIAGINKEISLLKCPSQLLHLEGKGNGASFQAVFDHALEKGREVIYFVEDDYLHMPTCIEEMVWAYADFKTNLSGKEVAICPVDEPVVHYEWRNLRPSRIVAGRNRYWRTDDWTCGTFMISRGALVQHWDRFTELARYGEHPDIHEDTTINHLWTDNVTLFSPVPSLAVHMQFPENIPPFVDWESVWKSTKL